MTADGLGNLDGAGHDNLRRARFSTPEAKSVYKPIPIREHQSLKALDNRLREDSSYRMPKQSPATIFHTLPGDTSFSPKNVAIRCPKERRFFMVDECLTAGTGATVCFARRPSGVPCG